MKQFITVNPVSPQYLSLLYSTLIIFLPIVESYEYEKGKMAPIVLVHGVTDSQIKGKYDQKTQPKNCDDESNDWEHFWLDVNIAIKGPDALKCWAHRFQLLYDRNNHKCTNQVGVETRMKGNFGSLKCCEYLTDDPVTKLLPMSQYFHEIIEALKNVGYSSDTSLKAACYDWRYAPKQLEEFGYITQLTELIERIATDTKRKVAIVAHSMGGLVAAYFLQKKPNEWKNKYIHAFLTSGTPWLGSTKAIGNYIVGNTYGIKTIRKSTMRNLVRTFQSIAFLLPQEEEFKDSVLVETQNRKYTAADYKQFFTDMALEDVFLMREDIRSLFPVPLNELGVRHICVYSNTSKIETPATFKVDAATMKDTDTMETINSDGDATVPLKSLRYCEKFKEVTVKVFQGLEHTGILNAKEFQDYVMESVTNAQSIS